MITDRIKHLMESKGLSAVAFAEKLGIQRSGLSHLFSGRNRPSLDLILKILEVFPDIQPEWLLQGKGDVTRFMSDDTTENTDVTSVNIKSESDVNNKSSGGITDVNTEITERVTDVNSESVVKNIPEDDDDQQPVYKVEMATVPENVPLPVTGEPDDEIIVLYPDGTYRSFAKRK